MPQSIAKVCVFDNVLHPALVEKAYEVFQAHRIPASTLYLPMEHLTNEERLLAELTLCVAEPAGAMLATYCRALWERAARVFDQPLDGFEIWTNCSTKSNAEVWFHFDNDEIERKESGQIKHPLFGSVLHLGPMIGMRGGETFFCLSDHAKLDQIIFRTISWSLLTGVLADSGMSVPFRAGRTILFDGRLAHCVAPFTLLDEQKPRLTLLVNGWSTRIKSAASI
jgi:hypothetical protein